MPQNPSPVELLSTALTKDIPRIDGWSVSQGASGSWTVSTPRGTVRIPATTQWTLASAESALERLENKGMGTALARSSGKKPRNVAKTSHRPEPQPQLEAEAAPVEKTPPAYPGEPSPDDGPVQRRVLLTPEMAQELLDRPWEAITSDGRKLRQRKREREGVDYFAALIRKGKLGLTYQGLGVGVNGSLYDGQHRCAAVVETGIAVWVMINYNVTPDEVLQLDSGRQRRASTKLSMEHFDHALALGSAARLLHYYTEYAMAQEVGDDDGELVTSEWRKWCNAKVNDLQVEEIVQQHPDLYQDLLWAVENKSPRKLAPNPPAVAVLRYIARQAWPTKECEKKMATFLDAVIFSVGINSVDHPAITLHRWLDKTGSTGIRQRFMREAHLFALIKAWNLFVDPPKPPKKPVKSFTENLGAKFPLPYKGS